MGDTYRQASKVHVWLGEASERDGVRAVFTALKCAAIKATSNDDSDLQRLEGPSGIPIHQDLVSICGSDWRALFKEFFSRPWFGRRWILQEAALGRDVVVRCGGEKISWVWFVAGIRAAYPYVPEHVAIRVPEFITAAQTILMIEQSHSLTLLLWLWEQHTQCLLPQDRIFAVYRLASDTERFGDLDYTNHWTDIYRQVAASYLINDSTALLRHLICFGSLSQVSSTYPSWVPN
jgi:hypothetical protein